MMFGPSTCPENRNRYNSNRRTNCVEWLSSSSTSKPSCIFARAGATTVGAA